MWFNRRKSIQANNTRQPANQVAAGGSGASDGAAEIPAKRATPPRGPKGKFVKPTVGYDGAA